MNSKNKLADLFTSLLETLKNEWHRLLIILSISGICFFLFKETKEEHYFHVSIEFLGVAVTFLLVEHVVRRLVSGIDDPRKLPVEEFLKSIKEATSELIIFDTFLETILLNGEGENYRDKFFNCLKHKVSTNRSFQIRILILKPDTTYANQRAKERHLKPNVHNKLMHQAIEELKKIKEHLEVDYPYYKNKMEIREYEESPPFAMYALDENAYVSFFPLGKKSTEARQLFIPNDTDLGKQLYLFFSATFEAKWNAAKPTLVTQ